MNITLTRRQSVLNNLSAELAQTERCMRFIDDDEDKDDTAKQVESVDAP
jgi:hypothetical protein